MQIVLTLADRRMQSAGQQVQDWRAQVTAEQEQLQQLEEYTEQYLQVYSTRKTGLYAQEMITYSDFIRRLDNARSEQLAKLQRVRQQYELSLEQWRVSHRRHDAIAEMIGRLQKEDNDVLEQRLQKELDELAAQQFQRKI
jgi:flagellar FliJ protein